MRGGIDLHGRRGWRFESSASGTIASRSMSLIGRRACRTGWGAAAYVRGHVRGCYRAGAVLPGDVPGAAAGKRSGSVRMIRSGCGADAYRASRCRWSSGRWARTPRPASPPRSSPASSRFTPVAATKAPSGWTALAAGALAAVGPLALARRISARAESTPQPGRRSPERAAVSVCTGSGRGRCEPRPRPGGQLL